MIVSDLELKSQSEATAGLTCQVLVFILKRITDVSPKLADFSTTSVILSFDINQNFILIPSRQRYQKTRKPFFKLAILDVQFFQYFYVKNIFYSFLLIPNISCLFTPLQSQITQLLNPFPTIGVSFPLSVITFFGFHSTLHLKTSSLGAFFGVLTTK